MSNVGLVRPAFAEELGRLDFDVNQMTPGGRLTLTTGVPVTTADVSGATSVYYTPYVNDVIPLWNGTRWVPINFADTALALGTLTNDRPYDVFGYLTGAYTLATELLAWTSSTARATGISIQGGRYCKTGDKTRLYLGTFHTTSTTTTEDSRGGTTSSIGGKRNLWNMYNRVLRSILMRNTGADWVYKTNAWRLQNGTTAPTGCVQVVIGLTEDVCVASYLQTVSMSVTTSRAIVGIGIDSSTTPSGVQQCAYFGGAAGVYSISAVGARYDDLLAVGYHYIAGLEFGASSADNQFSGGAVGQTGLYVEVPM